MRKLTYKRAPSPSEAPIPEAPPPEVGHPQLVAAPVLPRLTATADTPVLVETGPASREDSPPEPESEPDTEPESESPTAVDPAAPKRGRGGRRGGRRKAS